MGRLDRRVGPILVSAVFVVLGLIYVFGWGSIGQHTPGLWISPQDLWITFYSATEFAHGHFSAVYKANVSFVEFPGILLVLAPLGALSSSFHTTLLEVTKTGVVPARNFAANAVNVPFLNAQKFHFQGATYVSHPQWVTVVDPVALLLSCSVLFASDALAERLQVSQGRRVVLLLAEAVLLWNVILWWGHPEDAVALALAAYALIFALDSRFPAAGWTFGAAVAFQPLVLLMLPVLVAMAGRRHGLRLVVRSVVPAAVLLAGPFLANPRATLRAIVDQPSEPNVNHATPWTALSPNLGGHPVAVAAGPVRAIAVLLAVGLGIWVYRHWRERPELLVWACAAALALRSYTESVMTDYYAWAALALALVVAARADLVRFNIAVVAAVATTIVAQWKLGWLPWWALQVGGLTLVMAAASNPRVLVVVPAKQRGASRPDRSGTVAVPARTVTGTRNRNPSSVTTSRQGRSQTAAARLPVKGRSKSSGR